MTGAVQSSLQNTAKRSVIPSGHAGKQNVDLLMWFCAEGVTGLRLKILRLQEQRHSKQHGISEGLWTCADKDRTLAVKKKQP